MVDQTMSAIMRFGGGVDESKGVLGGFTDKVNRRWGCDDGCGRDGG